MITEQARSDVYLNGQQAGQELDKLATKAAKLKKQMVELRKANDKAGFDKKQKELRQVNSEMKNLQKQAFDVNKVLKSLSSSSINDLYKAQRTLNREMKKLPPNSKEYKQAAKDAGKLKSRIDKLKGSVKSTHNPLSKMKNLFLGLGVVTLIKRLGSELISLTKIIQGDAVRSSVVFGDQLGYVRGESEKLAKQMGLTNREFVAAAAGTADLLIPLDFSRKQAAKMSVELQSLAGALDEWTGGQIGATGVSEILTKAMLGENEQLKTLGIAIRKDSEEFRNLVKQKKADTGATKAQAEAMATLELIQKKSADAQEAYTGSGNKLLRIQKQLSVSVKNLKEEFLKLISAPISESLVEEGRRVNQLTVEILDSNTSYEDRLILLDKLERISPDIVKGINAEKIEYDKLNKNLQIYNDTLVKRIVLANLQEDEQKSLAKLAENSERLGKAQLAIGTLINNNNVGDILQDYDNWGERVQALTTYLEDVVKTEEEAAGVTEKMKKGFIQFGEMDPISDIWNQAKKDLRYIGDVLLPGYESSLSNFNDQQKNTTDFTNRINALEEILGLTEEIEIVIDPDNVAETAEEAERRLKASYKRVLNDMKVATQKQLNMYAEMRVAGAMDEEQYQEQLLVEKIAVLNAEIIIRKKFNEDYSDLEAELLKIEIDNINALQKEKDKALETEKEQKARAALEAIIAAEQKGIDFSKIEEKILDGQLERIKRLSKRKEKAAGDDEELLEELEKDADEATKNATRHIKNFTKSLAEHTAEITQLVGKDIANAWVDGFNQQKEVEQEYNEKVAELRLEREKGYIEENEYQDALAQLDEDRRKEDVKLEGIKGRLILVEILKYLRKVAHAKIAEGAIKSIAEYGLIIGAARTFLLTAAIEAAYGLAASKLSQNYAGRYPVVGASDNRTYMATPAGAAKTGIYTSPSIVAERGTEMIIDYPTYSNISMNRPDIIRDIQSLRVPQHAAGRYTDDNRPVSQGPSSPTQAQSNKEVVEEIRNLRKDLLAGNINAVVDDYQIREIRDRTTTINNIESEISK